MYLQNYATSCGVGKKANCIIFVAYAQQKFFDDNQDFETLQVELQASSTQTHGTSF